MNKDNAKEYLPLVQALAEGKVIQSLVGDVWIDNYAPIFNLNVSAYRIKPEPVKKWYKVVLLSCGTYCADTEQQEYQYEQHSSFIKWLTPRVEYVVEE